MAEPLYKIRQLSRTYRSGDHSEAVLSELTFDIATGEVVSIVGPSGSGKTTLLNIIAALDSGYEGRVVYGGRELKQYSDHELASLRNTDFGFVFQQFNLLDHLTVLENTLLPVHFSDAAVQQRESRASDLLGQVGLSDHIDKYPNQLSGGQKQRVSVARALINEPRVLFCDEPTGSLDRKTGANLMELFAKLREQTNSTFILVTHEDYIARFGGRIIRLENGQIQEVESADELSVALGDSGQKVARTC